MNYKMEINKSVIISCIVIFFISNTILIESNYAQGRINPLDSLEFNESNLITYCHKITEKELNSLKENIGFFCNPKEINFSKNDNNQTYFTGLKSPTNKEWEQIRNEAFVAEDIFYHATLPKNVDHSVSPFFPPIGNQSKESSCVSWSIVYYTKTYQEAKEHNWNLSHAKWERNHQDIGQPSPTYQDKIMSPDFVYHQINSGKNIGTTYWNTINVLNQIGACSWKKMPNDPFNHSSWPSEAAWRESILYRSDTKLNYILLYEQNGIRTLKKLLASGNLATISIDAGQYQVFDDNISIWTLDNYLGGSGHANTVVGYNDTFGPYYENGEKRYGAFKIINSWGPRYPSYWISYDAMKKRVLYSVFYLDKINYQPKLISVFQLNHSKRNDCLIQLQLINKDNVPLLKWFNIRPTSKKIFQFPIITGAYPFPDNKVVCDITEFSEEMIENKTYSIVLSVFDFGLPFGGLDQGVISHFSIEAFQNYSQGEPEIKVISDDIPIITSNNKREEAKIEITLDDHQYNLSIYDYYKNSFNDRGLLYRNCKDMITFIIRILELDDYGLIDNVIHKLLQTVNQF